MIKVKVNNEYKDVVKIFCGGTLQKEIIKVWSREAQEYVYESSVEYTGTLPITITANGDALIDYRIYGASGGVGVATENLFDKNANDVNKGYVEYGYLTADGTINTGTGASIFSISEYISLPLESETIFLENVGAISAPGIAICFYDDSQVYISGQAYGAIVSLSVQKPSNATLCRVTFLKARASIAYVGYTVPTNYIPHGYKLPMTVIDNLAPPLSQWVDGYITVGGTIAPPSNIYREKSSDFIEVDPNTKYVFSIEGGTFPKGTNGTWVGVGLYSDDWTFIYRYTSIKNSPYTFSVTSNTKYVRLSYRTYGESLEPRLSEFSFSIPICIGENQLDSIEGVSDYIDKSSGKIVRMIGEYTFTGDESFNKYGSSDVFYTSKTIDPVGITTVNTITMRCNHPAFTAIENKDTRYWLNPEADDICCFLPGGRSQVFLRSTSNFTTATECQAYLKSQYDNGTPVKISYWLKTPVEEEPPVPFPDIPTIKGETVIDYDGDPKPSQMYIKYRR